MGGAEQRGRAVNTFRIREVPNSHISPETGYHDSSFLCFPQSFRASAGGRLRHGSFLPRLFRFIIQ
jgi:hypothetical protein